MVHIIKNIGLARSLRIRFGECLKQGAGIIVNTDGDNQYAGKDISKLVEPIIKGYADLAIGDVQTHKITHLSFLKKSLQLLSGVVVGDLAGIRVPYTVSGFRAISREAAIKLNIIFSFSYSIEMVIQASKNTWQLSLYRFMPMLKLVNHVYLKPSLSLSSDNCPA